MALSGSSYNMFLFINRKSDIELNLSKLSMDKSQLSRDMQKVSLEYQNSLNQKTYKWSNNSGATYVDLSYNNLMKPSAMNLKKPYLLTDLNDRVVVDSEYKKYAEMISPNGTAGGDWESNRDKILAQIIGVSEADLNRQATLEATIYEKEEALNQAKEQEPDKYDYISKGTIDDILESSSLGSYSTVNIKNSDNKFSSGKNWLEAYDNNSTINIGTNFNDFNYIVAGDSSSDGLIGELAKIFPTADFNETAVEESLNAFKPVDGQTMNGDIIKQDENGNYIIQVKSLVDYLIAYFGQSANDDSNCKKDKYYYWEPGKYSQYKSTYDNWKNNELNPAQEAYDNAVNEFNQLFAGEDETLINFYDAIFSTIAEKGWVYNPSVQESDYVEQMLVNNAYTITTVDRVAEHDNENRTCEYKNDYDTTLASNFNKLFLVNDTESTQEAQAEYEYKKAIISRKETEIDNRMNNLNTELSAIKTMLEQLNKTGQENIDRTMEFSA